MKTPAALATVSETSERQIEAARRLDAAGDAGGAEAARRRDAALDRRERDVRLERHAGHAGTASADRARRRRAGDGSASRRVVVERVPWMIAAGSSGPIVTPARRASITACWPQRRKSAQPVQSCAIFSGTQMCGTIVKPMRTKCDGSCVNAHSVENPLAVAVVATSRHELRTDVAAAERLVDDERAHFGDLAAERRQLGAADDGVVDRGDDEPRHVPLDVLDAPRQQVADLEVVRDEPVDGRHVRRTRGPQCH